MESPPDAGAGAARHRPALLAAGLRATRHRVAVYDQVLRLDHPSAEEIHGRVRRESAAISLATVYKALDALVAGGLVARINTPGGPSRFDARLDQHYHLRCTRTGAVADLDTRFDPDLLGKVDPRLGDDLRARGFRLTGYRLEVVGYFADEPPAPAPAPEGHPNANP